MKLLMIAVLFFSMNSQAADHQHGANHKHDHKHDHKNEEKSQDLSKLPLPAPAPGSYKAVISVNGMVCSFCAQGIEKKFKARKEVDAVKVDLDTKQVLIHFKAGQAMSDADMKTIIADAGFTVTNIQVDVPKK